MASNGLKVALRLLENPSVNRDPDPEVIFLWLSVAVPEKVAVPDPT